ncbi:helix-turn-helix domain-containing protein [Lacticaseibacillus absianus]|uniref:helix-turn-helix domain-containing protein n=1 Tax=Lacticaseibacillus absianus TaxID=2729623 RepID=UPI0015C97162|nr:helix-turn-helix transcriptional regulator [Lacticaseibacillus absianus]
MLMTLGAQLREIRTRTGKTIATVAADSGISPASLSNWETNKQVPTLSSLRRLATYYEVDLNSLVSLRMQTRDNSRDQGDRELPIEELFDPNITLTFQQRPLDVETYKVVIAFLGGVLSASRATAAHATDQS